MSRRPVRARLDVLEERLRLPAGAWATTAPQPSSRCFARSAAREIGDAGGVPAVVQMAICGTLSINAPSAEVAYSLLERFGLRSEVETHGANAPIDVRVPFNSEDDLARLLHDLLDEMEKVDLDWIRLSVDEHSMVLER
jgi:hypothetical protein